MPALAEKRRTREDEISERLAQWRVDPVLFVRQALRAEPDDWQLEALGQLAAVNRIAIRSGHGVGKSTFLAWAILWFMNTRFPCKLPVTGSNFDQLKATLWAELVGWLQRMPEALRSAWTTTTEALRYTAEPEESFALLRTASKDRAQGLAGFHSKHILVVVDEASAVDDAIFEVLRGALTTTGAKMILTGNPTQRAGSFFRAFNDQRALYTTRRVSCLDSARVSREWIAEQAELYGVESNVYRVRVLGEFPRQDLDGVIPLDLIEAALVREVEPIDVRPVWGVDVARYGDDRSTIAKRQGNVQLEPVKARSGLDTEQVAGWIMREFLDTEQNMRPARINIDVIGIGAGVYDRLKREQRFRELGPTAIAGINVAEAPSSDGRYERLRDELWWNAREWFQARDCRLCDDQALVGELAGPKYEERPSGKIKVESKDEMKARGLRSPDLADGWILTFPGAVSAAMSTERGGFMRPQRAQATYNEHAL